MDDNVKTLQSSTVYSRGYKIIMNGTITKGQMISVQAMTSDKSSVESVVVGHV